MDRPLVRAGRYCVACGHNDKGAGLLLHWHCHDKLKARHDGGYGVCVNRKLDALEAQLQAEKEKV